MKDKTVLFNAIQDTLKWIDRTNEMINLHQSNDADKLTIEQYEDKRMEFLEDLSELLKELNIEIKLPLSKAS